MHRYYFTLLMVLGLLFSPGTSLACKKHHDAISKSPTTILAKSNAEEGCCKGIALPHSCNNHKHGKCGGKCCQCITSGVFKFLPLTVSERNTFFFIPSYKRHVFQYAELFVNADAKGLRLPPKIS